MLCFLMCAGNLNVTAWAATSPSSCAMLRSRPSLKSCTDKQMRCFWTCQVSCGYALLLACLVYYRGLLPAAGCNWLRAAAVFRLPYHFIYQCSGPWKVVESAAKCLRPDGRFCTFSPCIEQVQRTCEAMAANGFADIATFECLLREYEVRRDIEVKLFSS